MLDVSGSWFDLQRFDKSVAINFRFRKFPSIPYNLESLTGFLIWIKLNQRRKLIVIKIFCCLSSVRLTLYCCVVNARFVNLSHVNLLFNSATRNQSINYHIFILTNSINTINALVIIGWVPIRIYYYGSVSTSKIKANSRNLVGQQKTQNQWIIVKLLNHLLPFIYWHITIQT